MGESKIIRKGGGISVDDATAIESDVRTGETFYAGDTNDIRTGTYDGLTDINGVESSYTVATGETITKGDFVVDNGDGTVSKAYADAPDFSNFTFVTPTSLGLSYSKAVGLTETSGVAVGIKSGQLVAIGVDFDGTGNSSRTNTNDCVIDASGRNGDQYFNIAALGDTGMFMVVYMNNTVTTLQLALLKKEGSVLTKVHGEEVYTGRCYYPSIAAVTEYKVAIIGTDQTLSSYTTMFVVETNNQDPTLATGFNVGSTYTMQTTACQGGTALAHNFGTSNGIGMYMYSGNRYLFKHNYTISTTYGSRSISFGSQTTVSTVNDYDRHIHAVSTGTGYALLTYGDDSSHYIRSTSMSSTSLGSTKLLGSTYDYIIPFLHTDGAFYTIYDQSVFKHTVSGTSITENVNKYVSGVGSHKVLGMAGKYMYGVGTTVEGSQATYSDYVAKTGGIETETVTVILPEF